MVGTLLLLAGMAVALVHYLVESSDTMKFVTLAIAAPLLVVGWALLDWRQGISRRWGADESKGGPKIPAGQRRRLSNGPSATPAGLETSGE